MECIFIGDKFYWESGTLMSRVYEITSDGYERADWGSIQVALEKGKSVHIRPATEKEKVEFEKKLLEIKKDRKDYNENKKM